MEITESNLIVVRRLPEIEEHLQRVQEEIRARVSAALDMPCTEETVREVKKVRAALNKEFQELEDRRKQVKAAIMAPYKAFDQRYEDCAASLYRQADAHLKARIAQVEDGVKQDKLAKTAAYFEEYRQALGVPLEYAGLNQSGVRPTMSASVKSMKEAAKAYLDRVAEDLRLIDSQEGREEMLLEYRQCGSAAQAITTVKARWEAVEAEKRRQEERAGEEARAQELAEETTQAAQAWAPPQALPPQPEPQPEPRFTVRFTVKNVTKSQAKALREFLQQGGYNYE